MPEIKLKRVDLPDPFGPISPRTSPDLTPRSTLEMAVMPPKRLLTFLSSSSMLLAFIALGCGGDVGSALADRGEPTAHQEVVDKTAQTAWHEDHRQDDDRAEHRHAILIIIARQIVDDCHDDGTDDTSPNVSDPAEHDHQQQGYHLGDGVAVGVQKARRHVGLQAACAAGV